jgi:hypothetical protein
VHKHIFPAVIANDETKTLLRVEEFDNTRAFANDLGRHSAAAAAAKAAAATAATAIAAATAAAEAAAITAAETATVAIAATAAAAETATVAESSAIAKATAFKSAAKIAVTAKIVALVAAATAAIPLTPFIETHARPNSFVPIKIINQRAWAMGAVGYHARNARAQ